MKSNAIDRVLRLSLATLLVAGCSPKEPARTVSWYRDHAEDRKAMLARCSDDPGHLGHTPNCVNATQAEAREGIGHWKDLPPLNLPLPKKPPERDEDRSPGRS